MILINIFFLILGLVAVTKGSQLALKHAALLSKHMGFSTSAFGFIVVAFISILPETLISINAAFDGVPSLGLGTLFGSNVADLTLVVALVAFMASHHLKMSSKLDRISLVYIIILAIPLLLGIDGYYSRLEGILMILAGALFYVWLVRQDKTKEVKYTNGESTSWHMTLFVTGLLMLLLGAHLVVDQSVILAGYLSISPTLIGLLVLGIGATLPELFFSIKAVQSNHDGLALGDILGTVVIDATIVVGIVSFISPFEFSIRLIYITGLFMVISSAMLFWLMKSDRKLTKLEGVILLMMYLLFVLSELMAS